MSYLKVDDRFLDHPKAVRAVRLASSAAVHLWLGLLSYCKRNLSDGFVPVDMLPTVNGPATRYRSQALEALIAAGLVGRVEEGVVMHDYLQWNPSRTEIERKSADRKAAIERRRSGAAGSIERRSSVDAASEQRRNSRRPGVDAASELPSTVSNDVEPLASRGEEHAHGRARKTETETETEIFRDPPSPPMGVPTNEPEKKSSKRKRSGGSAGRTRCPADFEPDATTLAYATSLGFKPDVELKTRREFINWWTGDGGLKSNWQATYRNRLDVRAEHLGLRPPPPPENPQRRLALVETGKTRAEANAPTVPREKTRSLIDSAMASIGKPQGYAS